MTYQIIDNCISAEDFLLIKSTMLDGDFPWYYKNYKVAKDLPAEDSKQDFQFIHNFYNEYAPKSSFIGMIEPILAVINPSAIMRIKANLTVATDRIIEYPFHVDIKNFKGTTAVFYVNNNDGYTVFKDGSVVESKENRLVIFNSDVLHSGTTCTDEKIRCVINFNYYPWITD
jgi:hypothetical protein